MACVYSLLRELSKLYSKLAHGRLKTRRWLTPNGINPPTTEHAVTTPRAVTHQSRRPPPLVRSEIADRHGPGHGPGHGSRTRMVLRRPGGARASSQRSSRATSRSLSLSLVTRDDRARASMRRSVGRLRGVATPAASAVSLGAGRGTGYLLSPCSWMSLNQSPCSGTRLRQALGGAVDCVA